MRRKGGPGGTVYPGGAGAYGDTPGQDATGRPDFERGPGKRRKGGPGGPAPYAEPNAGEVPLTGAGSFRVSLYVVMRPLALPLVAVTLLSRPWRWPA